MIDGRTPAELGALEGPLAVSVGVFDGVHRGHRAVFRELRRAASEAGARCLVITLDPHPIEVVRPGTKVSLLTTPRERVLLAAESGEDAPDAFLTHRFAPEVAALPPLEFLRGALPAGCRLDELVIGYDFRMGKDRSGGFEELRRTGRREGFRVTRVGPAEVDGAPVSSTRIRSLVEDGRVREATRLLGHPYLVVGKVVQGRGVGRELDFPTANVDGEDGRKLLPGFGVYAVRVRIQGAGEDRLDGVANCGVRPTFGGGDPVLEVHLPGFRGDLTGRVLAVEVIGRIRDEQAFPSREALAERIGRDVEEARKILQERE
ncbi:riboflavin biosynthesis protein RibF [bacterium]|nr:riboflavin biosynthesis protein RibF [bacterium]